MFVLIFFNQSVMELCFWSLNLWVLVVELKVLIFNNWVLTTLVWTLTVCGSCGYSIQIVWFWTSDIARFLTALVCAVQRTLSSEETKSFRSAKSSKNCWRGLCVRTRKKFRNASNWYENWSISWRKWYTWLVNVSIIYDMIIIATC